MEHSYTIRAADGQEYGPATLEQLTGWVREGRVSSDTELKRSDMQHWSPAASFTELQSVFAPVAPVASAPGTPRTIAPTPVAASEDPQALAQLKSGASWFYWIAGLSLINSIAAFAGSDWRFILGLGATQVFDAIGNEIGGAGKVVTLGLDVVAAGVLVLFGVFGHKRHLWAFIVGMVLFALDGLVFLIAGDWIGIAFHIFVLYCLFRGLQACRSLNAG
jgi:hypothetical protein